MTPAADVYSLGATLYHLLTGQPAFLGENVRNRVIQGDFSRPRQVRRAIPAALEAIVLKAMANSATERYDSAAALADDVENWLGDEPVTAKLELELSDYGLSGATARVTRIYPDGAVPTPVRSPAPRQDVTFPPRTSWAWEIESQ